MNSELQINKKCKFIGKLEISKKNPDKYNKILSFNKKHFGSVKWGQKIYNYVNDILEPPTCATNNCNEPVKFHKYSQGYSKYCSNKCRYDDDELKKKIKDSYLKKYGVDNPLKSKEIQEKRKINYIKKYGVEHHSKLIDVIEKKKQTNLKRYGMTSNLHHEDTIKKSKQTNLEKYGVEHHSKSDLIKEKKKKTNLKNCGFESNLCLPKLRKMVKSKNDDLYLSKISSLIDVPINNLKLINDEIRISGFCNKHDFFDISKSNFYSRVVYYNNKERLCTKCYNIKTPSNVEVEFQQYVKDLNESIKINNRKLIPPYEIDLYLSDHNIGFEFNGLYWHSDLFKDKNYHLNKTNLCEERNIQLLHIFEDEWVNKKDIIKSIIKSKLGINEERIFARKCNVKEVYNNELIKEFLEKNHIQGFVGSKYKIGLFYGDDLVSLMTFGLKRRAMGNKKNVDGECEMLRFCNKLNTQVIGGASKLLKYFIREFKPNSILTFADRRYSQGNLYEKLGFEKKSVTKPNYYYFTKNDLRRYHRFKFRKDVLVKEGFDENKTEFQIMKERGFYRIYDCGNIKYELKIL